MLGIERYYFAFWRRPVLWDGARGVHRDQT